MRLEAFMRLAKPLTHPVAVGLLSFIAAFLLIFSSRAQEAATTGGSTNTTVRDAAKLRRAHLPFAKGTLVTNDLLRRMLKVRTEDGTRTFFFTDHTYIFRGKEKITADKLIVGEIVALRFDTDADGRDMIRRIKAYGTARPAEDKSSRATESPK
jgi:hypothetical protein